MKKMFDFVNENKPNSTYDIFVEVKYFTCGFWIHNDILPGYHSNQWSTTVFDK